MPKSHKAPPPRRFAANPSPSCSGKRPKVERWRGSRMLWQLKDPPLALAIERPPLALAIVRPSLALAIERSSSCSGKRSKVEREDVL